MCVCVFHCDRDYKTESSEKSILFIEAVYLSQKHFWGNGFSLSSSSVIARGESPCNQQFSSHQECLFQPGWWNWQNSSTDTKCQCYYSIPLPRWRLIETGVIFRFSLFIFLRAMSSVFILCRCRYFSYMLSVLEAKPWIFRLFGSENTHTI